MFKHTENLFIRLFDLGNSTISRGIETTDLPIKHTTYASSSEMYNVSIQSFV